MRPYSPKRKTKGQAGCRKSAATVRRARCLRVDKKAARQSVIPYTSCHTDGHGDGDYDE